MNNKPTYISKDGLDKLRARARGARLHPAARDRPAHPRRQGARRPHRERRVRGRQERAGVRRGPDPDARGADQERHPHRRAPLQRPRPDRLDRQGRRARTATRRSRSSGRPRRSRPRAGSATRARSGAPCSARRRARTSPSRCPRATSPTRSSRSLGASRPGLAGRRRSEESPPWTGPTSWRRGSPDPQVVNDSKTPSGTVHVGQPARAGHPRRHHPRAARARARDHAPVRRRRPRPDGRPGAPDARRGRALRWAGRSPTSRTR